MSKRTMMNKQPRKLIRTWEELSKCESETHVLEIEVDMCRGWIKRKDTNENDDFFENNHYLSTHTFYGYQHRASTRMLQKMRL